MLFLFPFRTKEEEKFDIRKFRAKAKNEEKKYQILTSLE